MIKDVMSREQMYQQTNCGGPPYSKRRFRTQRSLELLLSSTRDVYPAQDQQLEGGWPSEAEDGSDNGERQRESMIPRLLEKVH